MEVILLPYAPVEVHEKSASQRHLAGSRPSPTERSLGWSNDGGIPLQHCAVIDDGRACALEYNVVRWGKTELPPQAGIAVDVRGERGKLAAAHIYDDTDPPIGQGH